MYCSSCGSKDQVGRYCSDCGSRQGEYDLTLEAGGSAYEKQTVREPRLSFPPSNKEYAKSDFAEASEIWNSWTVWQRRIWNEAGRPDLNTFTGDEFEEWIIDNAEDDFDFANFVEEFSQNNRRSPDLKGKNLAAPWALGFGIASVFLFEFLLPMLVAIPLGIVGLNKAGELKRLGAEKTGFAQSLTGLILGSVFLLNAFLIVLGYGG